jgi:hypothetical protein
MSVSERNQELLDRLRRNLGKRNQDLLDRLPKDHALSASMRDAMIAALATAEQFSGHKIALASDRRMTELGQRQALKDALMANHGREWARAKAPVAKARREIKAARAALVVKPMDPADLVGAVLRQEIRGWIRSLDVGVRQSVVLGSKDRRVLEAALSAPPELSGITNPKAAAEIEERYIEIVYPRELAAIAADDAVVAEAEEAVGTAYNDLRSTVDMHPHDFSELMRSIEPEWPELTSDRSQVITIAADGTASYRPASAEEREHGVVYDPHKTAQGLAA